MAARRLRIYRVDERLFSEIFAENWNVRRFCVIQGVPRDAKFISIDSNWESRCVKLMYEHHTFEEVAEGQSPAEHSVEMMVTGDYTGEETTKMRRALADERHRRTEPRRDPSDPIDWDRVNRRKRKNPGQQSFKFAGM